MYNDNQKINDCQDISLITDYKIKDKKKWKQKKVENEELQKIYGNLSYKYDMEYFQNKHERLKSCSQYLHFLNLNDNKNLKLLYTNHCNVRLCPICSWRRSKKIFNQVSKVIDYVEENYNNRRFIFLTLTIKNCTSLELNNTIKLILKSFHKLTRRKLFKNVIKGYFRALEVTYNFNDNTYHPHIHCILMVEDNYFKNNYISQSQWTSLWKECIDSSYKPLVYIETCNMKEDKKTGKLNYSKSVAEVAKYTAKSKDYIFSLIDYNTRNRSKKYKNLLSLDKEEEMELNSEVVKVLDEALANKRLYSFGYEFKEIHNLLNLNDINSIDLDKCDSEVDIKSLNPLVKYTMVIFRWNIGFKNYLFVKERELNSMEKEFLNINEEI